MIAFLFIGGAHQVFHLAPVAAEAALRGHDVVCFYDGEVTRLALERVRRVTGASAMRIEPAEPPRWGRLAARALGRHSAAKGPLLWSLAHQLAKAEAVVTPERTSSALRFMGLGKQLLIHFRHGAGDRAPASERKLDRFDLVVVPGEKDIERAITRGVSPTKLRAAGYVKLDFLTREHAAQDPAGDHGPEIVVYNPHFDPAISSWPVARAVVEQFRAQDRYMLIFAPHVRLAEDMSAADHRRWQNLAEPGRILIDLGTPATIDMSYLLGSDIYLGDMSSQVYEFLARPRPVAFLNAHHVAWQEDPRYAGWHLGEVAEAPDQVIAAIDRAVVNQPALAAPQADAVARAFGDYRGAARRGAEIVLEAIAARG